MASNKIFQKAKQAKLDEFYTQREDIENELKNYEKEFRKKIKLEDGSERGMIVLCNCDDPIESEFVKYFAAKFKTFGLHKLMATSYYNSPISKDKIPYKATICGNVAFTEEGKLDLEETFRREGNEKKTLEGDGDFRSEECIELLKEADIVVTNPPFSLFREYISLLIRHEKKFLIIGNQNAITYKDVFPLLKDDKIWLGNSSNKTLVFQVPDGYRYDEKLTEKKNDGRHYGKVPAITWFTNLDLKKRHEELKLCKFYNEKDYPKFDNYDAISVNKVKDIPIDFEGKMGVPITYLDKHNSEQFEIVGCDMEFAQPVQLENGKIGTGRFYINGRRLYSRIIIRNLHPEPRLAPEQPITDNPSADLSDSMPASAPIISCAEDCSFQLRTMDRFNAMVAVTEGATVQQPQLPLAYADGEPTAEPQTEPTTETERPEDVPRLQPA